MGLDLLPIDPIAGATLLQGDFNDPDMPARLEALLGGTLDLVLSDMAPNTTGHGATDHIRIVALADWRSHFAMQVLAPGGAFVAKVFQGGSEKTMLAPMKRLFARSVTPSRRQPQGFQRTLCGGDRLSPACRLAPPFRRAFALADRVRAA